MTLASLPTLSVQIAFTPTNVQSLTQTWTDVTPYVRDFTTKLGRQHFLDRVEAGTLNMTVNERTGFFLNGSVNGTGYVIQPRLPIKVTATWAQTSSTSLTVGTGSKTFTLPTGLGVSIGLSVTLSNGANTMTGICTAYDNITTGSMTVNVTSTTGSGTFSSWSVAITYPIFYGLIDSVDEKITDQLNVDLSINATDLVKYLSLRYMASTNFWGNYASPVTIQYPNGVAASAVDWYRFTAPAQVVCTSAVNASGTVTYQGINNFSAGDQVFVTGFTGSTGTVTTTTGPGTVSASGLSSSQFVLTGIGGTSGASAGTGSAYLATVANGINAAKPGFVGYGNVMFQTNGAMVYSNDGCVDLANGSGEASGVASLPGYTTNQGAIDFWILGQGLGGTLVFSVNTNLGNEIDIKVSASGYLTVYNTTTMSVITTDTTAPINDGYWHHIGLVNNSSNQLCLYVDGNFTLISAGAYSGWNTYTGITTPPLIIGGTSNAVKTAPCQIDELVISSRTTTLFSEVTNRYVAGTLLTKGFPINASGVLSGDRIAQILCIAGFGTVSGGQVVLNSNTYYINDSSTAWVNGATGNGFIAVEPWYWDSPVTGSTALDLILQICDTDIGSFYQEPNGTFSYYNQLYYGTWSWNSTTSTGTWYPNSYSPTGDHVWTDDTSSTYHYFGPTLQVVRDDVDVWTTVKVSPQSGTEQIYENVANESRWGYSTLTKSGTLHTTLSLALSTATFLGRLFRTPLPRVGNVELRSETSNGANMTALLNTEFGDVVTFKRNSPNSSTSGSYPSQQGLISTNMVVESISHDFQAEPGFWHASFILDPYPIRN